ncbi:aspartokinase [Polaribacter pacificus]|uniref:Aspartokinase n=1 Tax=Polaribacter pacificus TaxID=1775173 RepID=A0A917HW05_9FLAO|nr:aspartate kinase [Polaribacter pacificus]GGG93254.1 aspartokinase [Polaribacter pacificus]
MIVLKFGGTSVGTASSIQQVVKIITECSAPKIVVLSAVSGTTNALVAINNALENNSFEEANLQLDLLYDSYLPLIDELYQNKSYQLSAKNFVTQIFSDIRAFKNKPFTTNDALFVLAQGEIISTNLVQLYLDERNISSCLLSALDFMKIDENKEPNIPYISKKLNPILKQQPEQKLWITQGFICKNSVGEIDNLQRGGSDYSASLIGAAIAATEVQIWTDIDGMHNNDPRYVNNTFSIEEISFDEAAELAYFGAKILHPQSLIPAKDNAIPVLLKNTFNPSARGTIIKNNAVKKGVRAIAAKDGITAIKIKSYRMLLAYGFLKTVFEVFEKYKTPIDMITTSEVAVSLTIDDTRYLEAIISELEALGKVEVDSTLSIICVAGDFSQNKEGESATVFNSLKGIPIRMISYGGSNYNVSLLVKTSDKVAALNALNQGLFNKSIEKPMEQLIG